MRSASGRPRRERRWKVVWLTPMPGIALRRKGNFGQLQRISGMACARAVWFMARAGQPRAKHYRTSRREDTEALDICRDQVVWRGCAQRVSWVERPNRELSSVFFFFLSDLSRPTKSSTLTHTHPEKHRTTLLISTLCITSSSSN